MSEPDIVLNLFNSFLNWGSCSMSWKCCISFEFTSEAVSSVFKFHFYLSMFKASVFNLNAFPKLCFSVVEYSICPFSDFLALKWHEEEKLLSMLLNCHLSYGITCSCESSSFCYKCISTIMAQFTEYAWKEGKVLKNNDKMKKEKRSKSKESTCNDALTCFHLCLLHCGGLTGGWC